MTKGWGLILNDPNSIHFINIELQYVDIYPPSIHVYVSELLQCCFHSGIEKKKEVKLIDQIYNSFNYSKTLSEYF